MNKNPLFKKWLLGLISLFSVLAVTGCSPYPISGIVIEKEMEPGGYEYDSHKKKWKYEEACNELEIEVEGGYLVERCVSQHVFDNALKDHHINLTEEYH